jgi:carbon-monoxide dehydrogenase medium subunit
MLKEHEGRARILAGGTDLLVNMKLMLEKPEYLLDLTKISNLGHIDYTEKHGLRIGPLARLRDIEKSNILTERYPVLSEASKEMATVQIRNMATIGGNVCNASPAADMAPPLLVINARMVIANSLGTRTVPIEEFFTGAKLTIMGPNEVLTEIRADDMPPDNRIVFLKFKRTAADLAIASVAVMIRRQNGICKDARVALGAVAETPIRAKSAEGFLKDRELDEKTINEAAQIAANETDPISDVRSTAAYRKHLVGILVQRAIRKAIKKGR